MQSILPETGVHTPAHKGILREETVALRQLLGYGRPTEASLRLGVPELGTRLPGSSMKDVLFVGLDIDTCQGYEVLIPDQQLHIGVSILDTRRLNDLLASTHERQLARVIRLVPVHYRNLELLSASAQQVHVWKVQIGSEHIGAKDQARVTR